MESEETGGTSQRGGGECLGRCRPEFALGTTRSALDAHDAVPVGEAVRRVLDRIEAHLLNDAPLNGVFALVHAVVHPDDRLIVVLTRLAPAIAGRRVGTQIPHWDDVKVAVVGRVGVAAHTRPLALSANQALIRQAPWNARMIAPRAVVYGRMSCMGVSFPQAALDEWFDSFHLSHAAGVTAPFVAFSICTCELRDGSLLPRTQ